MEQADDDSSDWARATGKQINGLVGGVSLWRVTGEPWTCADLWPLSSVEVSFWGEGRRNGEGELDSYGVGRPWRKVPKEYKLAHQNLG